MLGLTAWLEIITAILKFPETFLKIALLIKKTPEEVHEKLIADMTLEAAKFEDTGRGDWS